MIFESFLTFLNKILFFTSYVNNNGSFPKPLPIDEEMRRVKLAKDGDAESKEILIRHNLRLVAHIVKKYNNAAEVDDLISVGSIGLIKGINSFEYSKGTQLATYAARCIENEILMHIRANKKHRNSVSLSESVGTDKEGNEIVLMDILSDKEENTFVKVETAMLTEKMMAIVGEVLSEREYKIISLRYGLNGNPSLTQREVAKGLNISRSYISRIEKKAIEKIKGELKKRKF